jgi:NitT/TauT family transport system substrate-binding protein
VTVYLSTCAVTGGFMHVYTALDQNIFEKYGINVKHVVIRGGTNVNLAALGSDEVQFLYCAADSTMGAMAAGRDAMLIASPLVGLPYMIIARKEIRTVQDLKGKNIAIGTVAGLPFRLLTIFTKKFGLTDTEIRPIGGTQPERYAALLQGLVHSSAFTPPMDARAKKDGLNMSTMNDLGLPSIYSSLHTNAKSLRERQIVQRFGRRPRRAVQFAEANRIKLSGRR